MRALRDAGRVAGPGLAASRPALPDRSGRRGRWRSLALIGAVWLAGCASAPQTHFHTLVPAEPLAPAAGVVPGSGPRILLEPIRVPAAVDQPQWLVRLPDETLVQLEQDRWASALPDELSSALLEVLRSRFGIVDARAPGAGPAQWRVRVDIGRFESRQGLALMEASWSVTAAGAAAAALGCSASYREPAESGMPALSAAHRRIVVRLGEAIGEALLALQAGKTARCPG
jgi:uncharacterized lipoprotein YmbA